MMGTVVLTSVVFAQESKVPAAVKDAFRKQYPQAVKVEWEAEKGNYEAEFVSNGIRQSVLMDAAGKVLETEVEIKPEQLPEAAQTYLAQNYTGQKIKEAAKITDAKGGITYEAEVKGKDLIFDAAGNFIR